MNNRIGKTVFVAGGTNGINLAIAEGFAQAGARVAVLSRSADKVEAAVAHLRSLGADALGHAADVRDAGAVEAALAATSQAWGPLDVLVSGAAGNFLAPGAELSANGFKTVVDIDLLGTFNVMRMAWPYLRKPGAAVLNITAAQSWLPMPLQVHVCAAKAGIDQVTRTLAMEWGEAGVRVNAIAPGPIEGTEGMRRLAATPAAHKAWVNCVPLKRFGTAADIQRAALWLCSDAASYITGVVLPVDGGVALGGGAPIAAAMQA
ncbi:SDR family oxidoreductase [Burkholderia vietnamiensis]|uniref:SDR family oxidoreductase n=1 Tax=Burkholderia vietnamiensis TaxID=60552 RepID=A0AAW7SZJ0_BURVI|nr:SDR family oxidoreductase [Burkholderia vietnamiensis]MBH9645872.1 SDR family oxidoreductase [Burkholderia vietnamiensis]MBR8008819.1 SDR family oxidoreductase [Burkholderia vietnamiensis]MDN7551322.1 SDR family oxidoreductase [Burkholderia vietnamiensis]MDN7795136.1 SDR family oxidoreductase [Burkholderia vietnamiensis]MDN8045138.1 SDR family oxidoreductase [Burkholderia vietnamiensis]